MVKGLVLVPHAAGMARSFSTRTAKGFDVEGFLFRFACRQAVIRRNRFRQEFCLSSQVLMGFREKSGVLVLERQKALEKQNPTYICPMGARQLWLCCSIAALCPSCQRSISHSQWDLGLNSANKHASYMDQQLFIIVLLSAGRHDASIRGWASLPRPHAQISLPSRHTPPTHALRRYDDTPPSATPGPCPFLAHYEYP